MKRRWLWISLIMAGVLWGSPFSPCYAQKESKTLTVLYTNNINGEIDPCPT